MADSEWQRSRVAGEADRGTKNRGGWLSAMIACALLGAIACDSPSKACQIDCHPCSPDPGCECSSDGFCWSRYGCECPSSGASAGVGGASADAGSAVADDAGAGGAL